MTVKAYAIQVRTVDDTTGAEKLVWYIGEYADVVAEALRTNIAAQLHYLCRADEESVHRFWHDITALRAQDERRRAELAELDTLQIRLGGYREVPMLTHNALLDPEFLAAVNRYAELCKKYRSG